MIWTQVLVAVLSTFLGGGALWLFFWKYKKVSMVWELARKKVDNEQALYQTLENRVTELSNLYQQSRRESMEYSHQIDELNEEITKINTRNVQFRRDVGVLFKSCRCNNSDEIQEIRRRYDEAANT